MPCPDPRCDKGWIILTEAIVTTSEHLDGLTIGILDIAKARGDVFLHRLGERLAERGIAVKHYAKPTNTRVAPLPLRQQIAAEVDLVVEGLSD
jgi:hypothetical protein